MKANTYHFPKGRPIDLKTDASSQLLLAFASRERLEDKTVFPKLKASFPNADIVLNSTAGEIFHDGVFDDSLTLVSMAFESTEIVVEALNIGDVPSPEDLGKKLIKSLVGKNSSKKPLTHVLLISDGSLVNGSQLVLGCREALPENVGISGGLAGDGSLFNKTLVGYNGHASSGNVVVIGFYGRDLEVGVGSFGGWDTFGPKRLITKSEANKLYELDGRSALDLYKTYLGPEKSRNLPGSALLFPLCVFQDENTEALTRTILNIEEETGAMVFAGDVPEGCYAQLMKANFEKLITASGEAALRSNRHTTPPDFALLISCVGRKLILGQLVEEEIEEIRNYFGEDVPVAGFYSYGEIGPFADLLQCELHNQTMTVTSFKEQLRS